MTSRTLRERQPTDPSLHTLRFNRSLRDAGIRDSLDDNPSPGGFVAMLLAAIIGAPLLWALLVVVLSPGPSVTPEPNAAAAERHLSAYERIER